MARKHVTVVDTRVAIFMAHKYPRLRVYKSEVTVHVRRNMAGFKGYLKAGTLMEPLLAGHRFQECFSRMMSKYRG